jgi:hypothetical protein
MKRFVSGAPHASSFEGELPTGNDRTVAVRRQDSHSLRQQLEQLANCPREQILPLYFIGQPIDDGSCCSQVVVAIRLVTRVHDIERNDNLVVRAMRLNDSCQRVFANGILGATTSEVLVFVMKRGLVKWRVIAITNTYPHLHMD